MINITDILLMYLDSVHRLSLQTEHSVSETACFRPRVKTSRGALPTQFGPPKKLLQITGP